MDVGIVGQSSAIGVSIVGILYVLFLLGIFAFIISLILRFVRAVEKIADKFERT